MTYIQSIEQFSLTAKIQCTHDNGMDGKGERQKKVEARQQKKYLKKTRNE